MPTLSVIMPNYNHGHHIVQALNALLYQIRPPDEVIVVDDCSTDNSLQLVGAIMVKHRSVRLLRTAENYGPAAAIAFGLQLSRAEYVSFAAADDVVMPRLFQTSLALLEDHPTAGLCTAGICLLSPEGKDLGELPCSAAPDRAGSLGPTDVLARMIALGPWFYGNTAVYRRGALEIVGGLRESLGPYCDGFAMSAVALRFGACYSPSVLAAWRRSEDGFSAKTLKDVGATIAMYEKAYEIMVDELAHLFPPEYLALWRARVGLEPRGPREVM